MAIISFIGGTGKLGSALINRLKLVEEHTIYIGSRNSEELKQFKNIPVLSNENAAKRADIIFLTLPYNGQHHVLKSIKHFVKGKIIVDTTVNLKKSEDNISVSSAEQIQELFGEHAQVVCAFQTISYLKLLSDKDVQDTILVTSDKEEAANIIISLIGQMSLNSVYLGKLRYSKVLEMLVPILMSYNKRNERKDSGIVII